MADEEDDAIRTYCDDRPLEGAWAEDGEEEMAACELPVVWSAFVREASQQP